MIHGNIEGIRESILQELEKMYDIQFFRDEFLPDRLLNMLVKLMNLCLLNKLDLHHIL